jgi:hypothetical protein
MGNETSLKALREVMDPSDMARAELRCASIVFQNRSAKARVD